LNLESPPTAAFSIDLLEKNYVLFLQEQIKEIIIKNNKRHHHQKQ